MGKSAYNWDVYKNRKEALLELKRNLTRVDTILETEDGSVCEFVHSQVISAFGDKIHRYMNENGHYVEWPPTSATTMNQITENGKQFAYHTRSQSQRILKAEQESVKDAVASVGQHQHQHQLLLQQAANGGGSGGRSWRRVKLKLVRLAKSNRYTLGILVECAYSGLIKTDLSSGGIWQVLDFADHYEMVEVIRACCAFLVKNLDRSNCVQFYHIGIRHRHHLQRSAWHKIRANFKHILASNLRRLESIGRHQLPPPAHSGAQLVAHRKSRPEAEDEELERRLNNLATIKFEHFEALLMHDKLNVDNEESVWWAIRMWCNYRLEERAHQVSHLLACMRFPRFRQGTDFSAGFIWRDPLILNNAEAQHQLAVLDRNHRDMLSGGGGGGVGSRNSSRNGHQQELFQRDGFSLPCALQPRQLRPRVPHSILLAIGGWHQGTPTTLIESYDINCNLWFESPRRIMSPLAYFGVECIQGLLYICGGTDGSDILNEVFTFDPVRGDCAQRASMRESRCYVSTACLGPHLYAMGGHNGQQRMKSVERYEWLGGQVWEHVRDMNVARSDASACVHERHIYIAGGLNDQVIESSVEFYTREDDTWTFVASMLTPRTSFTILLFQGCLLAIGGNNGTERLASVEQYSFVSKLWSPHSEMRFRRSTFSAALVDENKLIVVGGYNGQTPFAQVEVYDEQQRQWLVLHKIRHDRSGLRVVTVSDLPNAADYTYLGRTAALAGLASFGATDLESTTSST